MAKLRCAIYCRVSSVMQKESDTIASQKSQLPKYAKAQGWSIYDIYVDEGLSGAFIAGREDFGRLMVDMGQNKFDVLLVAEHSRITRTEDPAERGLILKLLKDNRIKLASPAEGILDLSIFTGELMTTLKMMFAGEEKAEMIRRFRRGRNEKLSKGVYCLTSVPYGLKKITDSTIKPIKHEVVIDKDENQILRTVFDKIVNQNESINACAFYLNENGIKTRKGKSWSVAGLSSILRNEGGLIGCIYTGRYIFKTIAGKQELLEVKPLSECLKVKVPAIFTKAEFKFLRQKIGINKRNNMVKKEGFLLRGKLKCALCGAKFVPTSGGNVKNKIVKYYACHNRVKSPKRREPGEQPCKAPFVNMQYLDSLIERNLLYDLFRNPKHTLKLWTGTKGQHSKLDQVKRKLSKLDSEIKRNDSASAKLLHSFVTDLFTQEQLKIEQARLKGQRTLLEDERQKLAKECSDIERFKENLEIVKSTENEISGLMKNVAGSFKNMSFEDKQALISILIPHGQFIEISPAGDDEIRYKKIPEISRRIKINWTYSFSGMVDLKRLVEALKAYSQTGEMPSVPYIDVCYESSDHGNKRWDRRVFDKTF